MEFYKTTFQGTEITVIFNGSHYYFHSSYYGVVAIAGRDYDRTEFGWDKPHKTHFVVSVGNLRCQGGCLSDSVVATLAKRFVSKAETRHGMEDVTYDVVQQDLNKGYLECGYNSCRG